MSQQGEKGKGSKRPAKTAETIDPRQQNAPSGQNWQPIGQPSQQDQAGDGPGGGKALRARLRRRQQQSQASQTVQPEPRISGRQLMLIIALSRFTVMVVFLPVVTTGAAGRDAWLATILSVLGGLAVGALAAVLAARFPKQSIVGIARSAAGTLGLVLAALYGTYYMFVGLAEVRMLTMLLITVNLPNTPGWAISLAILLVAVYGAALGPDTLGRSSEVLITFLLASMLLGLALLLASQQLDFKLLRPVLARGFRPVLTSTLTPVLWFAISAGSVLALGKYCDPRRLAKAVGSGTLISGAVLLIMATVTIATLGASQAADQLSPLLSVARSIFYPGIAERIDVLMFSVLMIGAVFDFTLFLMVAAVIFSDLLRVRGRTVVVALGLLSLWPMSYRRIDLFDLLDLFEGIPPAIMLLTVHVGIVGLLLGIAAIRGKKGKKKP